MFSRFAPRVRFAAVAVVALVASAGSARADFVDFTGARTGTDPVSFSGRAELGPVTGSGATTTAVLKFTLTNTTSTGDAVQYGYITGFGFNVPTGVVASAPVVSDSDFKLLSKAANSTFLQADEFSYAFSTNANQLHTVANSEITKGLAAGQSATFQVTLTGAAVASLTAAQLLDLTAPAGAPLSVRFRTTDKTLYKGSIGDGDKVPVSKVIVPPPPPPPSGAVPAPPGVVLAGIGFGSLLLGRLRRK